MTTKRGFILVFLFATSAAVVRRTNAIDVSSIPWEDLSSELTSPDALSVNNNVMELWMEQCVPIFQSESFPFDAPLQNGSNYELIDQPNGLCADILSCAWKYCDWSPTSLVDLDETVPVPTTLQEYFDPSNVPNEAWNLPAATVHPTRVGDIITSIEFAKEHGLGMSVKVSGHNYVGASTDKDSLSINMRKYPKYAIDDTDTSVLECKQVTDNSTNDGTEQLTTNDLRAKACEVVARNFSAILRVGGGEIWDEAYRAVTNWNEAEGEQRYHVLGGGAGTVGAAGGYLGGTGLSGTTGMRLFGYAADQVTQMEMVLPSGQHVRFGPTKWTADPDLDWPRTTEVTGWCNTNPVIDEAEWIWEICPDEDSINFDDLWHAARGGGNGYGVTTAVEYQLHDYPGEISNMLMALPENFTVIAALACGDCEEAFGILSVTWLNFLIDITWNPSAVNVAEEDSNKCGGADGGASLSNIFGVFSLAFCYGDGGSIWAAAWRTVMSNSTLQQALLDAGATQEMIDMSSNALIPGVSVATDYTTLSTQEPVLGVPTGRLPDSPKPFSTYSWGVDNILVPIKFLLEQRDISIPWMLNYGLLGSGNYVMGGKIARFHDGTTATNPLYREAAFYGTLLKGNTAGTTELEQTLLRYYHGDGTPQDNFPGGSEFNHYQAQFMGPLKTNWSEPCPELTSGVSMEQRIDECIPLMEYIFGTQGLERLEGIKAAVDPTHLFNCFGCIGYRQASTPTSSPTPMTSDAALLLSHTIHVATVTAVTLLFW